METKFYYIRFKGYTNNPIVTVCLIRNKDCITSRGIAICSAKDNFSKKTGREISLARAKRANGTKKDHEKHLISFFKNRQKTMHAVELAFTLNLYSFKDINRLYEYDINPTKYETKILNNQNDKM